MKNMFHFWAGIFTGGLWWAWLIVRFFVKKTK